jgi:hypothetical protein
MNIQVPDELAESFMNLLDVVQSSFTEEEMKTFSGNEKKVILFIEKLLGDQKSHRYKTIQEKRKAREIFTKILY